MRGRQECHTRISASLPTKVPTVPFPNAGEGPSATSHLAKINGYIMRNDGTTNPERRDADAQRVEGARTSKRAGGRVSQDRTGSRDDPNGLK
jgi:hypothetical protein